MSSLTMAAQSKNHEFLKLVESGNDGASLKPTPDNEGLIISCPGRLVIHREWADDVFPFQHGRCLEERWDSLLETVEGRIVKKTTDIIVLEYPLE